VFPERLCVLVRWHLHLAAVLPVAAAVAYSMYAVNRGIGHHELEPQLRVICKIRALDAEVLTALRDPKTACAEPMARHRTYYTQLLDTRR
jgi:hypothetical protein